MFAELWEPWSVAARAPLAWLTLAGTVLGLALLRRCARYLPWSFPLLLPGVWLHECSHLLIGGLLGARPVAMSLWPRRAAGGWRLGHVGFAALSGPNRLPTLMAPLLLQPFGLWCLSRALREADPAWRASWIAAAAYAVWGGLPSSQDWRMAAGDLLRLSALAALGAVGYWLWRG